MHKYALTSTECEKIQGAQTIVETLGFFPAMEDAILEDVDIQFTHRLGCRYQVSMLFDLSQGGKRPVKEGKKKIRITFYGVREVFLRTDSIDFGSCCEIKFVGCRESIHDVKRDDLPGCTPVVSRPFTGFVMGTGRDFYLEFFDEECTVDAHFED